MIRNELATAIQNAVLDLYAIKLLSVEISDSQGGFGDYSTNVAFTLGKTVGKPPREVAGALVASISHPALLNAEVAGPGFINITLTNSYWQNRLDAIGPSFGKLELGKGTRVQVEYISANPTGPTTIGNARGGFIGEVLSRVLERAGYAVTREYYFNNAGTQIAKLLESVKMEAGILPTTDDRQYRGEYIAQLASEFHSELQTLNDAQMRELLTQTMLSRYIRPAVAKMGINFDVWFNENELLLDGSFDSAIAKLRELGLVFERDGATWLRTGELGDERDERVLIKSNGDPTYMAPDIAYHLNIFGIRGFDYAIKVLGPDHVAQFPSVYAAVHRLFPQAKFTMASYQWLRVVRGGKEVKVSKRLGQFITVEELIDQVTQPVAVFLTLMRSADSHMDFDLDLATETSAKNPYYYVMYAFARANSILAKAVTLNLNVASNSGQLDDRGLKLIRLMDRLPEMIAVMAEDYGVHRLTFFGLELAKAFTEYYEATRIIDLPKLEAEKSLYIVQQYVEFMKIYWDLLGIKAQTRLDR
jgi:arginyl-tRNA synthetase